MAKATPSPTVDVDKLPIVCGTEFFGRVIGWGSTYVARLCAEGTIPAVKVGKSWKINPREALKAMGLLHDTGEN